MHLRREERGLALLLGGEDRKTMCIERGYKVVDWIAAARIQSFLQSSLPTRRHTHPHFLHVIDSTFDLPVLDFHMW